MSTCHSNHNNHSQDIQDIEGTHIKVEQNLEYLKDWVLQIDNNGKNYEEIKRSVSRELKHIFTKNDYRKVYNTLKRESSYFNQFLETGLIKKRMRTMSGVLVCAVFTTAFPTYKDLKTGETKTQAFSCKHDCAYCPNEPAHEGNKWTAQPRSYLYNEPGVLRANHNDYDAIKQVRSRLTTYYRNGHTIDKIELIVLGGTWSEYPEQYQREFIRDCVYAVNTYNEFISGGFPPSSPLYCRAPWSLEAEIKFNDLYSDIKIIGITLETRPDTITVDEIIKMRSYGCTRVQLGVQHTDNVILDKINRGHTVEQTYQAIELLKNCGMKVDIHLMPNLPDSDVEKDQKMLFEAIYDQRLQADEWKIYPCAVVPWTQISKWYDEGLYKPYSDAELVQMLINVKAHVKPWVRLARVRRDIPDGYIANDKASNLRNDLSTLVNCACIRCREIKDNKILEEPKPVVRSYDASNGTEHFLSYETPKALSAKHESVDDKYIIGFLRLRTTDKPVDETLDDIRECALIRELHVYGVVVGTVPNSANGANGGGESQQHKGYGRKLIQMAEEIAIREGYQKIAVISGIGVREYYRKFGYKLSKNGYMVKTLI